MVSSVWSCVTLSKWNGHVFGVAVKVEHKSGTIFSERSVKKYVYRILGKIIRKEGRWYLYVIDGYGQGLDDVNGSGC